MGYEAQLGVQTLNLDKEILEGVIMEEQLGEMMPDSFPLALETPVTVDVPDIAAVTPNVTLAPDDIMGDKTDLKMFITYVFVTEY